jgi:hypothetical protein
MAEVKGTEELKRAVNKSGKTKQGEMGELQWIRVE